MQSNHSMDTGRLRILALPDKLHPRASVEEDTCVSYEEEDTCLINFIRARAWRRIHVCHMRRRIHA